MKFHTTSYHSHLLKDQDRLSVFYEAILEYAKNHQNHDLVCCDVGTGSGILSYFSQPYFKSILAIENNRDTYQCAKNNLSEFNNIEVLNDDVLDIKLDKEIDLILCEMLDTALIDEEEVLALKNIKKFLKKDGEIIPKGIFNIAELVNMEREYLHYADVDSNIKYETLSNSKIYSEFDFLEDINPDFKCQISFKIINDGIINGVILSSVVKVYENIVCGPTPMLNPPILIPLEKREVHSGDIINIELKYIMAHGIETINVKFI